MHFKNIKSSNPLCFHRWVKIKIEEVKRLHNEEKLGVLFYFDLACRYVDVFFYARE